MGTYLSGIIHGELAVDILCGSISLNRSMKCYAQIGTRHIPWEICKRYEAGYSARRERLGMGIERENG